MKCCLCGKKIVGYGNNPYPVDTDINGVKLPKDIFSSDDYTCCDDCNYELVIPARIAQLYNKRG